MNDIIGRICPRCNIFKLNELFYDFKRTYCKKCCSETTIKYRLKNLERHKKRVKILNSTPEYKNKRNKRRKIIRQQNPAIRIEENMRNKIRKMVKSGNYKTKSSNLLGCDKNFLKKYIESLWLEGMNWENYGYGENKWHVDHIICCELFDFSDYEQQKICFNYKNLQPIWQRDNINKSDLLPNGKRARLMSKEEKIEYLKFLGYNI